jgi:hypothetical protein
MTRMRFTSGGCKSKSFPRGTGAPLRGRAWPDCSGQAASGATTAPGLRRKGRGASEVARAAGGRARWRGSYVYHSHILDSRWTQHPIVCLCL